MKKKESAKQSGSARKTAADKATIASKPGTGGNTKAIGKQIGGKGTGGAGGKKC